MKHNEEQRERKLRQHSGTRAGDYQRRNHNEVLHHSNGERQEKFNINSTQ